MNDSAAPAKPKGWPLFAIAILVLLLAGFLYLKWKKKDNGPAIVKQPPTAVEPAPPSKAPEAPPAAPPTATTPSEGEFEQRLQEFQKAADDKRWDDAAASLAAARKVRPDAKELKDADARLVEGRRKEQAELAEAEARREEQRKRGKEWAALKDEVEQASKQDRWDSAIEMLEKFAKTWPAVSSDEDYVNTLRRVRNFQKDADKEFNKDLAKAQKLFGDGSYSQAIAVAENALKYYPERQAQVRELQNRAREAQAEKSMVRIPSSSCWIGSNERDDEKPFREVKLPPFLIDKYEVTNEEYAAFVAAAGYAAPPFWPNGKIPKGRERHPVVFVSWDDAAAFAKWAGKRLPTAEEWEVAARGPDKREFPWGNTFLEKEERYPCNCLEYWQYNKVENPGTTPVDKKDFDCGESAFGVCGMGGNVWEWTATAAPAKGAKPPPEFRVLKGGSFMTPQKAVRCANVYADDPRLGHPDVGFRCVRDVK